jgi:SOS-response transcriptional repressor LexA
MTLGLTQKQAEALRFIRGFIEEKGFSPNYAEIAAGLGYASKGPAHAIVRSLVERGYVVAGDRKARSISLTRLAA